MRLARMRLILLLLFAALSVGCQSMPSRQFVAGPRTAPQNLPSYAAASQSAPRSIPASTVSDARLTSPTPSWLSGRSSSAASCYT